MGTGMRIEIHWHCPACGLEHRDPLEISLAGASAPTIDLGSLVCTKCGHRSPVQLSIAGISAALDPIADLTAGEIPSPPEETSGLAQKVRSARNPSGN